MRSKQLSSDSICCTQVFARFSGHGNSIYNIIPLLKKKKKCIKILNLLIPYFLSGEIVVMDS